MITVYIVYGTIPYEGDRDLGIFKTEEEAIKYRDELKSSNETLYKFYDEILVSKVRVWDSVDERKKTLDAEMAEWHRLNP